MDRVGSQRSNLSGPFMKATGTGLRAGRNRSPDRGKAPSVDWVFLRERQASKVMVWPWAPLSHVWENIARAMVRLPQGYLWGPRRAFRLRFRKACLPPRFALLRFETPYGHTTWWQSIHSKLLKSA